MQTGKSCTGLPLRRQCGKKAGRGGCCLRDYRYPAGMAGSVSGRLRMPKTALFWCEMRCSAQHPGGRRQKVRTSQKHACGLLHNDRYRHASRIAFQCAGLVSGRRLTRCRKRSSSAPATVRPDTSPTQNPCDAIGDAGHGIQSGARPSRQPTGSAMP